MDTLNLVILAIISLFVLFQLSFYYKAWRLKGSKVGTILKEEGISGNYDELLLFFHSDHCPPCKQMMPDIKSLMENNPNIIPIDIGIFMNLARRLNVRATPTTLFIKNGEVKKVLLGRQSRRVIEKLFVSK